MEAALEKPNKKNGMKDENRSCACRFLHPVEIGVIWAEGATKCQQHRGVTLTL